MPGAGFIESRALLGFMPRSAEHLLGEDLAMPNIATWWCGQAGARAKVLSDLSQMSIAGAFGERVPGFDAEQQVLPETLPAGGRGTAARGDRGARRRLCRPGDRAAVDDAGLGAGAAGAAAVRAARLRGGDAGRLAGDARRLLPDLREGRCARGQHGRGRAVGRRVGAVGKAGGARDAAAVAARRSAFAAFSATCRAAPPTTCSGTAAISSAPRRCCGSSAACAAAASSSI